MNLFSKNLSVFLIILFWSLYSSAITIYSLHTTECERELGFIIDVRPFEVILLTLDGKVQTVRNYEIIYMSSYSVNQIPIKEKINIQGINGYEFYTRIGNTPVSLTKGFPIDFTHEKISIINYEGVETILEKNKIWSIERFTDHTVDFKYSSSNSITFDMPQIFRDCQRNDNFPSGFRKTVDLYPLQTLSDPLSIKRELDRLRQGYQQIEDMNQEQQFYGEPQYFKNISILGTWGNLQSRYGSSAYRTNQFLPTLINSTSDGPFDFQQRTVTGVAPNYRGSHDEPQAQLSYDLKSSYFHLFLMFDPNLMLVGQNYDWTQLDFKSPDVRVTDKTLFEFGFDYSVISVQLFLQHQVHTGFFDGLIFEKQDFSIPRLAITLRGLTYNVFVTSGGTDLVERSTKFKMDLKRLHIEISAFKNITAKAGYLTRRSEASQRVSISQESNSLYLELDHIWNRRYLLGGLVSNESIRNQILQKETQSTFLKTAIFLGFIF